MMARQVNLMINGDDRFEMRRDAQKQSVALVEDVIPTASNRIGSPCMELLLLVLILF